MMRSESMKDPEHSNPVSTGIDNRSSRHFNAPIVQQPESRFHSVRFNRSYIFSTQGLLCSILIVVLFAAFVSAAAVPKLVNGEVHLLPEFAAVRDAYLFFSITGLLIALFTLIIYTFNLVTVRPLNRFPIVLFIISVDILWLVAFFILAIMCAIKEETLKDPVFIYGIYINTGAYGSASFFGFLASLVYGVDAGFLIIKAMRGSLVM